MRFLYLHTVMLNYAHGCAGFCWWVHFLAIRDGGICTGYEKYKGDALLQKSYTVDFLTKKKKINEGEVPQYYVENSHPAIIEPETFDLVQLEMKKRKEAKFGTQIVNTEEPYGNATTSLRMKRNARLHISMRTRLKKHLLKLLIV